MPNFPDHIQKLHPYVPGLAISALAARIGVSSDAIVKLASNENPLGASPLARQALREADPELALYPDNDSIELTTAIARFHRVPPEWIVTGSGSEAVLSMAVTSLVCPGRNTVYSQHSFQAYSTAVQKVGAKAVVVPSPDFRVDLDGILARIDQDTALVYIANPGNPTGTFLDNAAVESFLARVPGHVVVLLDEAYFEYLPEDLRTRSIEWVRTYPNLLVTRTFSKAYGLAGLRVGYGIAQGQVAEMLRRVRAPFSVTRLAQLAATAALGDGAFLSETVRCNAAGLDELYRGLRELGLRYIESHANFVLVHVGDGIALSARLTELGVIVRPLRSYALDEWIRISVGTPQQNAAVLAAMRRILQS